MKWDKSIEVCLIKESEKKKSKICLQSSSGILESSLIKKILKYLLMKQ